MTTTQLVPLHWLVHVHDTLSNIQNISILYKQHSPTKQPTYLSVHFKTSTFHSQLNSTNFTSTTIQTPQKSNPLPDPTNLSNPSTHLKTPTIHNISDFYLSYPLPISYDLTSIMTINQCLLSLPIYHIAPNTPALANIHTTT